MAILPESRQVGWKIARRGGLFGIFEVFRFRFMYRNEGLTGSYF
jgi:hypothetical protein